MQQWIPPQQDVTTESCCVKQIPVTPLLYDCAFGWSKYLSMGGVLTGVGEFNHGGSG